MPRPQKPFVIQKRNDCKAFLLTLNSTSGLPARVCKEWNRRSFQNFPSELIIHSNPKTKAAAEAATMALIAFLKNTDSSRHVVKSNILVGEWIQKFTSITESPKGARNIAENRPYSLRTVDRLKSLYDTHIKDDIFMDFKMSEVEPEDALAFVNRMGLRRLEGKYKYSTKEAPTIAGTETFFKLINFVRMVFKEYGRNKLNWKNPFQGIDPPRNIRRAERDALSEEEVLRLFRSGVLLDPMEVAVCTVMFLSGLRRAEIFALRPEHLDWNTPKVIVCQAWQNFDSKRRVMGPPKGKRSRNAPFDKVLQNAIKNLWEKNGKHGFVFSYKDGTTPGPGWIEGRFSKWLVRAGINTVGRNITPHSSRHSLASILEARGVPLRYIQEMLGHSDLKTTKRYLHSTERTIRDIGMKIDDLMEASTIPESIEGAKVLKVV